MIKEETWKGKETPPLYHQAFICGDPDARAGWKSMSNEARTELLLAYLYGLMDSYHSQRSTTDTDPDVADPLDPVLECVLGMCDCGKPPDGFVKVGRDRWMTHRNCKTRWRALSVPPWFRMTEEMLREAVPQLLEYEEIPGRPSWMGVPFVESSAYDRLPDPVKEKRIKDLFNTARLLARKSVKGPALGRILREEGREGLIRVLSPFDLGQ